MTEHDPARPAVNSADLASMSLSELQALADVIRALCDAGTDLQTRGFASRFDLTPGAPVRIVLPAARMPLPGPDDMGARLPLPGPADMGARLPLPGPDDMGARLRRLIEARPVVTGTPQPVVVMPAVPVEPAAGAAPGQDAEPAAELAAEQAAEPEPDPAPRVAKGAPWTAEEDARAVQMLAGALGRDGLSWRAAALLVADVLDRTPEGVLFRFQKDAARRAAIEAAIADLAAARDAGAADIQAPEAPPKAPPEIQTPEIQTPAPVLDDAAQGSGGAGDVAAPPPAAPEGALKSGPAPAVAAAGRAARVGVPKPHAVPRARQVAVPPVMPRPVTVPPDLPAELRPIAAHLAEMTPFGRWTAARDRDLFRLAEESRWPLHEICLDLEVSTAQAQQRFSVLTGGAKFKRAEVWAAMQAVGYGAGDL